jgi:hypothetical protein
MNMVQPRVRGMVLAAALPEADAFAGAAEVDAADAADAAGAAGAADGAPKVGGVSVGGATPIEGAPIDGGARFGAPIVGGGRPVPGAPGKPGGGAAIDGTVPLPSEPSDGALGRPPSAGTDAPGDGVGFGAPSVGGAPRVPGPVMIAGRGGIVPGRSVFGLAVLPAAAAEPA